MSKVTYLVYPKVRIYEEYRKLSFRNVDAEQLTRTQSGLHDYFGGTAAKIPLFAYFPRADKESENPFLPDFGNAMLKRGEFENVMFRLLNFKDSFSRQF